MRRIIYFILCIVFILNLTTIFASDYDVESIPTWSNSVETLAQIKNKVELELDCESAILLDENTGTILYTKNEHEKLRPASVTKIMTLLLIMEELEAGRISLTDRVPCSANASSMGGSQIWLDETEELTVDEMLKAICVVSANDCCVAMSEFIAGSEEAFVEKMNARAKELGMNDTNFVNCHGIDADGHLTSAYDIAIMSRELSKNHPEIHNYSTIWMDTLRDGKSQLVNTNKLVRFYSGCTGLKTGSTSLALFNLSATATRNDLSLIAVVLRGTTSQKRFDDAKKLLDYGFANFSNKVLVTKGEVVTEIEISKSQQTKVEITAEENLTALINKGDEKNVRTEIVLNENIKAPLEYLEPVGMLKCYLNDEVVGEVNLVANSKVEKKSVIDFWVEMTLFSYKLRKIKFKNIIIYNAKSVT